ncbi:uncharacterized mitochondrial protein AtMg00310-like [Humulus lupulus]|uniref:uncharacterized mitochondrial protein AtMg00310-like n=1 Tax=Humulus lupulus TaxID=3486 RepID=UPI002B403845|nr:uncharacterized mitochondrial protein AtMg00310-like [Humulus lupulus]
MSSSKSIGRMGFRNLRDFNLALLGKQGWRLMEREESLVGKVFKARYYPRGSFINANLGANPSFIWRSIWETQELLKSGMRWSIGSGNNVNILGEPWLPDRLDPMVVSMHPMLQHQKVSVLMKIEEKAWDEDLINDLFEERDIKLIYSIPLSFTVGHDRWY